MSDDLELPDHIDPSRWPFCEARARAAAALSSFPEPPLRGAGDAMSRRRYALAYRGGYRMDGGGGAIHRQRWEARRRVQRLGEAS